MGTVLSSFGIATKIYNLDFPFTFVIKILPNWKFWLYILFMDFWL